MKRIDKVNKNKRVRMILSNDEVLEGNSVTIGKVTSYILATEKKTEILVIERLDIHNRVIEVILNNSK